MTVKWRRFSLFDGLGTERSYSTDFEDLSSFLFCKRKYFLDLIVILIFNLKTYWKISFVRIGMDFRRSITFVTVPSATIDVIRTIKSTSTCPTIGYIRISENKKKIREITEWMLSIQKNYQKLRLKKFVKLQQFCTFRLFISQEKNCKIKSYKSSWKYNGCLQTECFRLFISWEKLPKSKVEKKIVKL